MIEKIVRSPTKIISLVPTPTSLLVSIIIGISSMLGQTGCSKKSEEQATTSAPTTTPTASEPTPPAESTPPPDPRYLYVAAGTCFSGTGITTFTSTTASNQIFRLAVDTAKKDMTIADFYSPDYNSGDSPVGMIDGTDSLYVLVENTAGRRIQKMNKENNAPFSIFSSNTTMLSAVLRNMIKLTDDSILISKSSAIEKMTMGKTRITMGGTNPYINAPGGSCATSNTLISSLAQLGNGNLVYAHAGASPNNLIGIVSAGGYKTVADCKAAQAAPATTAYPTAMVYINSVKQLIVAYGGATLTAGINSIQVYTIDETNNTFGSPTTIYDIASYPTTYPYLLYGISAMAYDPVDSSIYIATVVSASTPASNYAIEKFTYDPVKKELTRTGSIPFYNYGLDTKCISSMFVGN